MYMTSMLHLSLRHRSNIHHRRTVKRCPPAVDNVTVLQLCQGAMDHSNRGQGTNPGWGGIQPSEGAQVRPATA
jgi:hypothetical protein